ncbi:MAG: hypothetical protein SFU98_14695 [Leptospiraceae bacterium]|nr:hypothetical protein [Leptospiraceae bacterium]
MQTIKKIILFFLFSIMYISCYESKLQYTGDYKKFLTQAARLTCKKIQKCYHHTIRTFPSGEDHFDVEECMNHSLKDIDSKISKFSEEIIQLSIACYPKVVEASCKDFSFIYFKNTSCTTLFFRLQEMRK